MNMEIRFTEEELSMMSNGIIALIHDAETAKSQVNKRSTKAIIDTEVNELISLNNKICSAMER